jgi:hypothetical protein
VVAVVNGSPIRLAELEARHDLGRISLPQADNPAVEELQAELGAVLADTIAARLVRQELDRLGLAPSAGELAEAEAAVRGEYPGEAFERMLLEEHIDLARWREMLADRLALDKFRQDVLRPSVRVGVSEAAAYYKEHIDAFTRPAMVRLRVVTGRDAEAVKAALAAGRKAGPGEPPAGVETTMPETGLPPAWREALAAKKPGEATAPLAMGREYLALVLLERLPATVLDPAKAYARVEAMLTAEKLAKAFDLWLAGALRKASIRVNPRLLPQAPARPSLAQTGGTNEEAELMAAKTQGEASDFIAGEARRTLAARQAAPAGASPAARESAPATRMPPPAVAEETPQPLAVAETEPVEPSPPTLPGAVASSTRTPDVSGPGEASPPQSLSQPPGPGATSPEGPPAPSLPVQAALLSESVPAQPAQPAASDMPPSPAILPAEPAKAGQESGPGPVSPQPAPARDAATGPGEVEFTAVKASWILYTVDEGREERIYLKPGKPHRVAYLRRLTVRLGSPSVVAYRAGERTETIEVGKKESRLLEFP